MKRIYPSGSQKRKQKKEEEHKKTQDSAVPSTASLIDEKDNEEEEDMEETTSTGAMASTSTYIESALHLSTGVTSTAQATLIDEEDNMGEEDMGGTTSSGTMASTSTQIASPPHLSTGDTSTAQGTTSTFIIDDDPAQWPKVLTDSERCQIVGKGPVQITDIEFPQNSENPPRRFTKENYRRTMKNGEKILRSWLVYSMSTDSEFCFPCTVFGKCDNALSNCGFHKWKNLTYHLKEHEYSKGHCDNMRNWHELQRRLQNKTTIDKDSKP
ncbi:uncharacterized protein LOC143499580 isoform X2 [Brachyhypopomus gauderio]|uniref:uncharacterized protein LOC143499580 isoform X2 n=1 Tax=Brachyhypopomus gauderio TaxID=698409 RepID=UPI0040425956